MSFLKRFTKTTPRGPARVSRSDVDLPSVKRPKGTSVPQLVLDRIPKHMDMKSGDEYFIPSAIASIRIDIEWTRVSRVPVDVECVVMLLDADLRRVDYLTTQRKVSRDKSIMFMEDHQGQQAAQVRKDSIGLKLKSVANEISHVIVLFTVKSTSKTLADIIGPTLTMYDVGYFPGAPELLRYSFEAEERFYPGTAVVMLSETQPVGQQRMWSLVALDTPLVGRSFRQISDDIEELVNTELQRDREGVAYGGDYQRVLSEELTKKAMHYTDVTRYKREEKPPKETSDIETDSTASEKSDEDSIKMFYIQNGVSAYRPADASNIGNLRPTVVRKSYRKYTTGKGVTPQHMDCESESEDENANLFRVTFPKYADKSVTRYGNHAYNIGSESADLYTHYLSHKESLTKSARESSAVILKPIEVNMVPNQVDVGGSSEVGRPLKPPLPEIMQSLARSSKEQRLSGRSEQPNVFLSSPTPPNQPKSSKGWQMRSRGHGNQ